MAVVEQVAAVLNRLANSEEGMSVMQLARAVNLPRSTMSRLLIQMRTYGLIERDPATHRHRPGLMIAEAARRCGSGDSLLDRAARAMAALSREVGHTTGLVQMDGDEVLEVRACVGSAPLRVVLPPADRAPLFGTGTGRALLAWETDAEVALRWKPQPKGLFEAPPETLPELLDRLKVIRARGWEEIAGDPNHDIGGVAAAFEEERTGERLCIYTVFSLLHVGEDDRHNVGEALRRYAATVGRVLGPQDTKHMGGVTG